MFRKGLAKLTFQEIHQKAPWKKKEISPSVSPLLNQLLGLRALSYLDIAFAYRLLNGIDSTNEPAAFFIFHLLQAAKNGHLCVQVDHTVFLPSVESLWQISLEQLLEPALVAKIRELILTGSQQLPSHLLAPTEECSHALFYHAHGLYYLQKHWVMESHLWKELQGYLITPPTLSLDLQAIDNTLTQLCQEGSLLAEQAEAVLHCCTHSLTLISGGPGTGKTYTAGHLIKVLWQNLSSEQQRRAVFTPSDRISVSRERSDVAFCDEGIALGVSENASILDSGLFCPQRSFQCKGNINQYGPYTESSAKGKRTPNLGRYHFSDAPLAIAEEKNATDDLLAGDRKLTEGVNTAQRSIEIVLAAPTGKAAANLQQSLGKATAGLAGLPNLQAKTLHAILGLRSESSSQFTPIPLTADLVVVDESSMIDVRLMGLLFQAIKPGSRLILLGDQHQLPSVEAGSLFHDLIQLSSRLPSIGYGHLKKCLRAELQAILKLAELVNMGHSREAIEWIKKDGHSGLKQATLTKNFAYEMAARFPSLTSQELSQEELLKMFNGFRLLSPLRKGHFGVDELNQQILQHCLQKKSHRGWLAIPIMVVTNDYQRDLFNGETGVLMRRLSYQGINAEDYALFPPRLPQEPPRRIAALQLPKYEYAYCLSVYKSQGSEFDHVVLALPEGSEIFGREMLYTAITRAKRQIDLYGSDEVITRTIAQQSIRLSGLSRRADPYTQVQILPVPVCVPEILSTRHFDQHEY